jgi:hypothetical protein
MKLRFTTKDENIKSVVCLRHGQMSIKCIFVLNKIRIHIKAVDDVHKILPTAKIAVEAASFDIQKVKIQIYQEPNASKAIRWAFGMRGKCVLFRDGHACRGRKGCKNHISAIRRIETRRIGGDAPNNPATLRKDCHSGYRDAAFMGIGMPLSASGCQKRHHAGKLKLNLKRGRSFRGAAFVWIMRRAFCSRLKEDYPNAGTAYGCTAKNARIRNGLKKITRQARDALAEIQNPFL